MFKSLWEKSQESMENNVERVETVRNFIINLLIWGYLHFLITLYMINIRHER